MQTLEDIQDRFRARIVYGEPIETEGAIVIPAARVAGGGGAGSDQANNAGGGFGLTARPAGAWIIENGDARWKPAIDVNQVILGAQVLGVVFLVISWLKARSRRLD